MYTGLKHAHSGLAYLVLLALIIAVVYYLMKFIGKQPLSPKDKKIALIAMILTHIQLLIGLIQWFMSPYFKQLTNDFSGTMEVSSLRLLALEHPVINIIAVIFITMAYSGVKKNIAASRPASLANWLFFLIGLALILSRVPWNQWM